MAGIGTYLSKQSRVIVSFFCALHWDANDRIVGDTKIHVDRPFVAARGLMRLASSDERLHSTGPVQPAAVLPDSLTRTDTCCDSMRRAVSS